MAQYFTDFSDYADGTPGDWTSRWVAPASFSVVSDAAATGGKALEVVKSSQARTLLSWDAVDGDADRASSEVLLRARILTKPTTAFYLAGAARCSGPSGTETGYAGGLASSNGGQDELNKYSAGLYTGLGSGAVSEWTTGTYYWIRFQAIGTMVRVRRWAGAFEDEPGTWSVSATDSTISDAGWVGVFCFPATTFTIDLVGVGTGGDAAPSGILALPPRTRLVMQQRVAGSWV